MNEDALKKLLEDVKDGKVEIESAYDQLKSLPYEDLGFAKIDHHREIRTGYPEVIYCLGKTVKQIQNIVLKLSERNNNILATRASLEVFNGIKQVISDCEYFEEARIVVVKKREIIFSDKKIVVILSLIHI